MDPRWRADAHMILWFCGYLAGAFVYMCAASAFEDQSWKPFALTVGFMAIMAFVVVSIP